VGQPWPSAFEEGGIKASSTLHNYDIVAQTVLLLGVSKSLVLVLNAVTSLQALSRPPLVFCPRTTQPREMRPDALPPAERTRPSSWLHRLLDRSPPVQGRDGLFVRLPHPARQIMKMLGKRDVACFTKAASSRAISRLMEFLAKAHDLTQVNIRSSGDAQHFLLPRFQPQLSSRTRMIVPLAAIHSHRLFPTQTPLSIPLRDF